MNPGAPQSPTIHLFLVDDSELVRVGLRSLLQSMPEVCIVGEAGCGAEALARVPGLKVDVVLMDIRLPDGRGIEWCQRLLEASPEVRVLMLTSCSDPETVEAAVMAGALGYLLKEINASGLFAGIRQVAAGQSVMDPQLAHLLFRQFKREGLGQKLGQLTAQERRVLDCVARGQSNKEIAEALGLSEKTVKNHLSHIFEKLGVTRRTQAMIVYQQLLAGQ